MKAAPLVFGSIEFSHGTFKFQQPSRLGGIGRVVAVCQKSCPGHGQSECLHDGGFDVRKEKLLVQVIQVDFEFYPAHDTPTQNLVVCQLKTGGTSWVACWRTGSVASNIAELSVSNRFMLFQWHDVNVSPDYFGSIR